MPKAPLPTLLRRMWNRLASPSKSTGWKEMVRCQRDIYAQGRIGLLRVYNKSRPLERPGRLSGAEDGRRECGTAREGFGDESQCHSPICY